MYHCVSSKKKPHALVILAIGSIDGQDNTNILFILSQQTEKPFTSACVSVRSIYSAEFDWFIEKVQFVINVSPKLEG